MLSLWRSHAGVDTKAASQGPVFVGSHFSAPVTGRAAGCKSNSNSFLWLFVHLS